MSRMRHSAVRYAIAGALAAGLLAGCAGSNHLARAGAYAARQSGKVDQGVARAEAAVAKSPNEAPARFALGQAYLEAGRFQSAATSFGDAMKLGDTSGRTQLLLALAQIGAGRNTAAVAVLDEARDSIPAGDRGLALALAGETGRGVAILADALRGGESSPKLRQNLAYALALDGRWREARMAMSQDVPADQIDDRIGAWASTAQPEAVQQRVAALLGVPAGVADAGQPAQLALGGVPQDEQLAAADVPAPVAQSAAAELPALDQAPAAAPKPSEFADAFIPEAAPAPAAAAAAASQPGFVSQPVTQTITAEAPVARPRSKRVAGFTHGFVQAAPAQPVGLRSAAPQPVLASGGSHLVQLGSFSSEANARRAWGILSARNPELRGSRMTITQAVVRGKTFWRVAAAGYTATTAVRACSGVKNRGGKCFAYSAANVPAGAKPALAHAGPVKVRR